MLELIEEEICKKKVNKYFAAFSDAKKAKVHRSVCLPFGTSEQIFQAIGEQYFFCYKNTEKYSTGSPP